MVQEGGLTNPGEEKLLKILSLSWHNVVPDCINPEHLAGAVTTSKFREHITFIKKSFTPISVVDFMEIQKNKRLIQSYIKPPVLLGFDDGFKFVFHQLCRY